MNLSCFYLSILVGPLRPPYSSLQPLVSPLMDSHTVNRFVLALDTERPFEIMINIPHLLLDFRNYARSACEFIDPFISQWQLRHLVGIREIKYNYATYVTIQIFFNPTQSREIMHREAWPRYYLWKRVDGPWWELSSTPRWEWTSNWLFLNPKLTNFLCHAYSPNFTGFPEIVEPESIFPVWENIWLTLDFRARTNLTALLDHSFSHHDAHTIPDGYFYSEASWLFKRGREAQLLAGTDIIFGGIS